jgi:hypothetical protein
MTGELANVDKRTLLVVSTAKPTSEARLVNESGKGDIPMARVMVRCPKTQRIVYTGISVADKANFGSSAITGRAFDKNQAFLEIPPLDKALPSGGGR